MKLIPHAINQRTFTPNTLQGFLLVVPTFSLPYLRCVCGGGGMHPRVCLSSFICVVVFFPKPSVSFIFFFFVLRMFFLSVIYFPHVYSFYLFFTHLPLSSFFYYYSNVSLSLFLQSSICFIPFSHAFAVGPSHYHSPFICLHHYTAARSPFPLSPTRPPPSIHAFHLSSHAPIHLS